MHRDGHCFHSSFHFTAAEGAARGCAETQLSPLNIYINAGEPCSLSNLNAGFATSVPFFDYDLIAIAPITTNCRARFASAGGRAGGSNAVLVAHLVSACGHGKYCRTCYSTSRPQ
jgi:hypothetical protein